MGEEENEKGKVEGKGVTGGDQTNTNGVSQAEKEKEEHNKSLTGDKEEMGEVIKVKYDNMETILSIQTFQDYYADAEVEKPKDKTAMEMKGGDFIVDVDMDQNEKIDEKKESKEDRDL